MHTHFEYTFALQRVVLLAYMHGRIGGTFVRVMCCRYIPVQLANRSFIHVRTTLGFDRYCGIDTHSVVMLACMNVHWWESIGKEISLL